RLSGENLRTWFDLHFFGGSIVDSRFSRSTNGWWRRIASPTLRCRQVKEKNRANPKNHALPVVRSSGGRGGRLLCLDFSEFEDHQGDPLRQGWSWGGRLGNDRRLSARRTIVCCPQWRVAIQV